MNEAHHEGKGNLSCPICHGAMTEQNTSYTFYDVIKVDARHHVCENGHTTETEEDCDRICEALKGKERHLILSYVGKLIAFSIAGAALFLFSAWAALVLIPAYAPKAIASHSTAIALLIGAVSVVGLCFLLPRFFKTFIAYYWAKQKSRKNTA